MHGTIISNVLTFNMAEEIYTQLIQECRHNSYGVRLSSRLRCSLERMGISERQALVSRIVGGAAPLWVAARRGNNEVVVYLVTVCGAPLEQHGELKMAGARHRAPPLWIAAVSGHLSTCTTLLELGADVESVSTSGSTALRSALYCGRAAVARLLIARGANPNALDVNRSTPLINAAQSVHLCALLLSSGANFTTADVYGRTALHHAASAGRTDAVRLLLAAGADPSVSGVDGDDALRIAAMKGATEVVRAILESNHYSATTIADAFDLIGCSFLLDRGDDRSAINWWREANTHRKLNQEIPDDLESLTYYAHTVTQNILGPSHRLTVNRIMNNVRRQREANNLEGSIRTIACAMRIFIDHGTILSLEASDCLKEVMLLLQSWQESDYQLIVMLFDTIVTALPEASSLMKIQPQCKRQMEYFDFLLSVVISILQILLPQTLTDDQKNTLYQKIIRLVNYGIRSACSGEALLHKAVRRNAVLVAKVLLTCGADPNARNYCRETALHVVPYDLHVTNDTPIVRVLLQGGVHRDTPNAFGDIATFPAPQQVFPLACLAANALDTARVNYEDLPKTLISFVQLHK